MTWISTPRGLYGESGIRTHGTLTSTHAFQACTFGHSVISPRHRMCRGRRRHGWRRRRPRPRTGRGRRVHGCTSDDQDTGCTSSQTTSRREWDSNPRSRKRLNGFRDRPIRPLSHLSKTQDGSRSAKYMDVPEPTLRHGWYEAVPCMEAQATTLRHGCPNTRSPPAHAGGDQSLRAQEDSNLRPLDPQSNALSRLSYGHPAVSGVLLLPDLLRRASTRMRGRLSFLYGEGGIRTPGTLTGTTP